MAKYTEAQKKAVYKYRTKHFKRISIDFPTDDFEALKKAAAIEEDSITGFVKRAVKDRIEQVLENQAKDGDKNDDEDE